IKRPRRIFFGLSGDLIAQPDFAGHAAIVQRDTVALGVQNFLHGFRDTRIGRWPDGFNLASLSGGERESDKSYKQVDCSHPGVYISLRGTMVMRGMQVPKCLSGECSDERTAFAV